MPEVMGHLGQHLAVKSLAGPASHPVEGITDVEQLQVCRVDVAVRAICQPCGGEGPEDGHVAESPS